MQGPKIFFLILFIVSYESAKNEPYKKCHVFDKFGMTQAYIS